MAAIGTQEDAKTQELNAIIKSLGARGKESQKWKKNEGHFWNNVFSHVFSDILSKLSGNSIIIRPYGSAAEDLKFEEPDDVGDVDIMVFPDSDNLLIYGEMIEYSTSNPLHVRVKGGDHPVFKFCCVKDTGYLSTSAVKDSHEDIYGELGDTLPRAFQLMSREDPSSTAGFTCQLKSSSSSPALKVNLTLASEELTSTSLQPSIRRWPANLYQFQEKSKHKPVREETEGVNDKSDKKQNGDHSGNQTEPKRQGQPLAYKTELRTQSGGGNQETEKKQLERIREEKAMERVCNHLFRNINKENEDLNSKLKFQDNERAQHRVAAGIDYVPALRSPEWPKVAQEWIKRERKWPSPDIVEKVIHEGFHLVVKPPKNGGNPDCDFRISFSHAEYLLSQEMNDIQRECYRCLKKFHRAYLSIKTGSLVTFHLKNILLQTLEETGTEMWTECNRAECMIRLLENLFEALTSKDLPHYFVRSYNLFCCDYIENPEILASLARIVEQIIENPLPFAKELIQNQHYLGSDELASSMSSAKHGKTRQGHLSEGNNENQRKPMEVNQKGISPFTVCQYNDLKSVYLATSKELTDIVFNGQEGVEQIESLDPLEKSLVHDFRDIAMKTGFDNEEFTRMLDLYWNMVYLNVLLNSELNMRRRMLHAFRGVAEMWKYLLKQDEFLTGNCAEAIIPRMLGLTAGEPFDLSHFIPAGCGCQLMRMLNSSSSPELRPVPSEDHIPLD